MIRLFTRYIGASYYKKYNDDLEKHRNLHLHFNDFIKTEKLISQNEFDIITNCITLAGQEVNLKDKTSFFKEYPNSKSNNRAYLEVLIVDNKWTDYFDKIDGNKIQKYIDEVQLLWNTSLYQIVKDIKEKAETDCPILIKQGVSKDQQQINLEQDIQEIYDLFNKITYLP